MQSCKPETNKRNDPALLNDQPALINDVVATIDIESFSGD
jgi:hypothetical protein